MSYATPTREPTAPGDVTTGALLAGAPLGAFQLRVVALAAAAVVMDGLDNQLVGFIVPSLLKEWALTKAAIAPMIALSLLAMCVGTAGAGMLGDRLGRRPVLISSVLLFGLATLAAAATSNLAEFTAVRMVAALGLGGAMPNATALLAEFTPSRRRGTLVTLGIVCVPLGGLLGGLLAAAVLPAAGWRMLCTINGMIPVIGAGLFLLLLPESPALLAARGRIDRANVILARCGIDQRLATAGPSAQSMPRGAFADLFRHGLGRETMLTWAFFFFCLLSVYSVFSWGPTMLAAQGLGSVAASSGLTAFNLGGMVGALLGGIGIDRFGSRRIMLASALAGAFLALYATLSPPGSDTTMLWIVIFFTLLGAVVSGLQTNLFALAAHIYPVQLRASGVGWALAVGRLGAVLSALTGAWTLQSGNAPYFALIAGAMLVTAAAIALLRRHIAPEKGRR